eukprot:686725-Pelagomonas_calceolata.AAC.2
MADPAGLASAAWWCAWCRNRLPVLPLLCPKLVESGAPGTAHPDCSERVPARVSQGPQALHIQIQKKGFKMTAIQWQSRRRNASTMGRITIGALHLCQLNQHQSPAMYANAGPCKKNKGWKEGRVTCWGPTNKRVRIDEIWAVPMAGPLLPRQKAAISYRQEAAIS